MTQRTAAHGSQSDTLAVYVTFPNQEEAIRVSETVVTERRAACANILPGATSIYRWKGELCRDAEVVTIFKTAAAQFDRLAARLRDLHSYECPCIVAFPHCAIDSDYRNWLLENAGPLPGDPG